MAGSGQGRTGDAEMCQLHWCQQPLRAMEKVIPCDLSASTFVSKETVKVVFEVISASCIGMLGERVTR